MYALPLTTFNDFLDHDQGLACWCPGCQRRAHADVEMLVRNGMGEKEVKKCRPLCRVCGQYGIWSFTGPVPRIPGNYPDI